MEEEVKKKIRNLLVDMAEKTEWSTLVNDIARYFKIKELVINSFKAVLVLSPEPVRVIIQDKINKLEDSESIFEFQDLKGFFKLAQILATGLLSYLDDKEVHDFAAPHRAVGHLDSLVRISENRKYSEDNVSALGAAISVELKSLQAHLEKIDWRDGWRK